MSALKKNVASQVVTFNLVNATSGAALTGATVTTKVALDGTQSASGGTLTELGTGQYKYVPTQGETNGTTVGFSFTATNAVPVNLHCFTIGQDPTLSTFDTNVLKWNGTAVSSPATAGIPDINVKNINNVAAATPGAAGGVFIAGTNAATTITTGLTTTFTGNLTGSVASVTGAVGSVTGAIGSVASGGITDASFAAGTGKKVVRASTAVAGAATTITLDASASGTDSFYNGELVYLTGGTGVGQVRRIIGYVGATQVATVDRAWQTNPDNTSTFAILPEEGAKVDSNLKIQGVVLTDTLTTYTGNTPQTADVAAVKTQTDKLTFTVANQVDSNVIDWKSATAPAMTGDAFARIGAAGAGLTAVAIGTGGIANTAFAASAIDAAAIATDAIGSAELAAGAVTKIWAQVVTELAQATPSATPAVQDAIALLYMIARNQVTVTATNKKFTNDAGTVIIRKALTDDGTTYAEAKAVAGP